uniref:LSM domain-containing protein n=1 Tax=Lygus hesperus TaxID=30085 RepID=A0A0A9XGA5_LYGHE
MSVSPNNIITTYQLRSIGCYIQLYTYKGFIIEGVLKEVDVNGNVHLADGQLYWFFTVNTGRSNFKNLIVMGNEISCFVPNPYPAFLPPVQPLISHTVPTKE